VCLAFFALSAPAAFADTPEHFTDEFPFEFVVDCGTFTFTETGTFHQHGTVFTNKNGEDTRAIVVETYEGLFTLSNSSKTFTEKGTHTLMISADSFTVSGQAFTIRGDNFKLYDVGRLVFDADGNLVFASAKHPLTSVSDGDAVLCEAFAP
jgi:hypothetical protein